jgi:hypothetical protein
VHAVAPWLVTTSFLLFFVALMGVGVMLRRWRDHLPLLLTLILLPAGHVLARMRYPFTSTQDFRYSTLLLLPLAVAFGLALEHMPKSLRSMSAVVAGVFCALATLCTISVLQW